MDFIKIYVNTIADIKYKLIRNPMLVSFSVFIDIIANGLVCGFLRVLAINYARCCATFFV